MPSTSSFRVTRVRLRHYRSIAACDVRLSELTFLVGPNGSGKSNFVDSLRFVSQALGENLDNALRERGGHAEVRRRSTGHPTHFGIRLDFQGDGMSGEYGFQVAAVKGGDYRLSHEECIVRSVEFGGEDSRFVIRDGRLVDSSFKTPLPSPSADRLYLVLASALPDFRPVFDGLSALNVFNLNPEAMRRLQTPDAGDVLRRDGSNIASVLERLRRVDASVKEEIEEYLRVIVPGVVSADRKGFGSWETVEFRQEVQGADSPWTFPATSMSDGTLRALGVLVALFAPSDQVYSPIAIEEPESALHPAASGALMDALRSASESRQVIATSHSPDLLDDPAVRPDQIRAVSADGGVTRISDLDEVAEGALRDSLYTAGELLRANQLTPRFDQPSLELFT